MLEKTFIHAGRRVSIHTQQKGNRWDWSGDIDGTPFRNFDEFALSEREAMEDASAEARHRIDAGEV